MQPEHKRVVTNYNSVSNIYDTQYRQEDDFIDLREKDIFQEQIGDISGKHILDFGCGTGRFSLYLLTKNPQSLLGVDLSPGMIKIARTKANDPRLKFQVYDPARQTDPFSENGFTLITCIEVIEYQNDPQEFFTVVNNNLRPGGTLFFDFINRLNFLVFLKSRLNHEWRENNVKLYTVGEIRELCQRNYVEILHLNGVHMLLLPKFVISKVSFFKSLALWVEKILDRLPGFKYLFSYRIIVTARLIK